MICNICGAEIPNGENTCKYCGNVMNVPERKENVDQTRRVEIPKRPDPKPPVTHHYENVYHDNRRNGKYCIKCGRPLDGATNKCIVCDAAAVSRRAYTNEEFKNREMNIMAQKRKKKKQTNTVLKVTLAILATILLFLAAIIFALGMSKRLGIGGNDDNSTNSSVTVTYKPKKTADPDWEPENIGTPRPTAKPTVKPTDEPVRTPVPNSTADPVDERGGKYLYDTDKKVITVNELDKYKNQSNGRETIKRIYWEIYARHGYTFDDDLADYFETSHSWYMPTTSDKSEVESQFNSYEKENIKIIEDYQRKQGWRQ